MPDTGKSSVVFQGSKFFWRTRNSIDVTIVQHDKANIIEIIAYEPSIDVEAERIYLNSAVLNDRLDHVEIEAKFSFAKQNNVPISTAFITSVTNHAITDYILTRLLISKFSKEESQFEIKLEFSSRDTDSALGGQPLDGLFCGKAEELKPFETKKHKILAAGEVDAALQALEEERTQLKASCEQAAIHHTEASVPLTVKERWRIPIVLIKMDKGKVLSAGDTKIWEAVSANLKTQEDIDRVTKVTMRTVTTKAQLDAARNAATKRRHKAPSPAHRVPASPARSPLPTPRSQAVTPRATPRSASSRLYASTATSQARAQCAAEDLSPTPTAPKTPRKLAKRSSSKVIPVRNSSKTIRRSSTRSRLAGPRGSSDSQVENSQEPDADYSGSMDYSAALVGIGENTRGSFASQVAAGLSSFVSTFSTKTKPSTSSTKSGIAGGLSARSGSFGAEAGQFPTQGSFGAASGNLSGAASGDFSDDVPQPHHHHISDLVSFLVGKKSSSIKFVPESHAEKYAEPTVTSRELTTGGASVKLQHQVDQTTTSPSAPMSTQPSLLHTDSHLEDAKNVPPKRRSFFGAMLAPFIRTDSGHSYAAANAGAHAGAEVGTYQQGSNANSPKAPGNSTQQTKAAPVKRRSFFGALIANLTRTDSNHSQASCNASVANASVANASVANDEAADVVGELPVLEPVDKPQPVPHHSLGDSLSSWLPWGHGHASSATVVPVNLAEYTRAQFAE